MIQNWWEEISVYIWVGYGLVIKLKKLKEKIKDWVWGPLWQIEVIKANIINDILYLDKE